LYQYWFLLVQWLTESRFGISKFGIPIEIFECVWVVYFEGLYMRG